MVESNEKYELFCGGSCKGNPGPAGSAAILYNQNGKMIGGGYKFIGNSTNNIAEYQAVLLGLDAAINHGIRNVNVYTDSQLVIGQVTGQWKVKERKFQPLVDEARQKLDLIRGNLIKISKDDNEVVCSFAKDAVNKRETNIF